jgi:uncharacterized protein YcfJ
MTTKILSGIAVTALALTAQAAFAHGPDHGYYADDDRDDDYARVIDVDPITQPVRVSQPVQQCWTETRYAPGRVVARRREDPGAILMGGLLGAVLGHQVAGRGDHGAGTVAGAVIGGAVGRELGAGQDRYGTDFEEPRAYDVERCATRAADRYVEQVVAYHVTYVYAGRRFQTQLPYDPGPRIRVDVRARPIG